MTAIFTLLPLSAPGEGPNWHPYVREYPYPRNGNRLDNWDPHIVYEFNFKPTDHLTPIIKYGISDLAKNGLDRPENQLARFKAIYGSTATYRILTLTNNRQAALNKEQQLVNDHFKIWRAMPREQINPSPEP